MHVERCVFSLQIDEGQNMMSASFHTERLYCPSAKCRSVVGVAHDAAGAVTDTPHASP